jgi:arylsulfatase A-like enzyme
VPAFVNWRGHLKPSKVTAPLHAVDWFPTLSALTGYRPLRDMHLDGKNVWPTVTGDLVSPPPRTLYWPDRKQSAVRSGDWKLIVDKQGHAELFNLAADPYEKTELSAREPDRVRDLRARLRELQADDQKEIPADLRDVP